MSALPPQPIGQSDAFHSLLAHVSDAAALEMPVLVVGERGTGKELIASRLHFLSPRWETAYVRVNCAAFTDESLDAELFGRAAGRSQSEQTGRFEEADGGTLFLDNICSVSNRMQEKLLRAVEHGSFEPHNSTETIEVDVRIVTATGSDLPRAVAQGQFRADLLDRLAFDVITLPPLRARPDDIQPLSDYFGRKMAVKLGGDQFPGFAAEVMETLLSYAWPGNVRELKNVVERSLARHFLKDESLSTVMDTAIFDPFDGPWSQMLSLAPLVAPLSAPMSAPLLTPASVAPPASHPSNMPSMVSLTSPDFAAAPEQQAPAAGAPAQPGDPGATAQTQDFSERVMVFERGLIDEALFSNKNHQGQAADYLGLTYHQFRGLLRKHGMKK